MDPISALGVGASIITLADIALKSAKAIHRVLSGVRDGPDNIKQAVVAVGGLLLTLEQLSKCRALDQNGSEALTAHVLACINDLERFHEKLKILVIGAEEQRRERYWKNIKAIFNERALVNMSSTVAGHTSTLNLALNVLQRYVQFA